MSSCSAASRREAPPSTRAITRMRMSAEYAFGIVRPPDESMPPDSPTYRSLGTLRFYSARTCSSSLRKNLETEPMFSQVRVDFWRWIELWSLRSAVDYAATSFGDADQIVGDQVEQEIGSNSGDAAMLGLAHCTVLFAPAKDAFGHRPARLRDAVALVPRGASVDGAAATLAG